MQDIKNQVEKLEDDYEELKTLIQTMTHALSEIIDNCDDAYCLISLQKIIDRKSANITEEIEGLWNKIYIK